MQQWGACLQSRANSGRPGHTQCLAGWGGDGERVCPRRAVSTEGLLREAEWRGVVTTLSLFFTLKIFLCVRCAPIVRPA